MDEDWFHCAHMCASCKCWHFCGSSYESRSYVPLLPICYNFVAFTPEFLLYNRALMCAVGFAYIFCCLAALVGLWAKGSENATHFEPGRSNTVLTVEKWILFAFAVFATVSSSLVIVPNILLLGQQYNIWPIRPDNTITSTLFCLNSTANFIIFSFALPIFGLLLGNR